MLTFPTASFVPLLLSSSVLYFISWIIYKLIYNIYFHPLAHIPGPKLAGATYLYQTYYNFAGGSKFYLKIPELHKQYGPVIRVTPDEVHLSDTSNYDKIYYVGSKYTKGPFYDAFGIPFSMFTLRSNEAHRLLRGALSPFFSRKSVLVAEDIVQSKAKKLCDIIATGQEVDLHHGFRAISIDVMTEYAFADCMNLLDRPGFGDSFLALFRNIGTSMWLAQAFPRLQKFLLSFPPWLAGALNSSVGEVLKLQLHAREQCIRVKERMDSGTISESRQSIFHTLLSPDDKHEDYVIPTIDEIKCEAVTFFGAAADTTGGVLTKAAYSILADPRIHARLRKELSDAFPDINEGMDLVQLEQLPYLSVIIKESLRLAFGVSGRLQRIVPDGGATFNNVFIPAGSQISMSAWQCHRDPSYFPSPLDFRPERWLIDAASVRRMESALVPFSKGSRACVGMPLAYAELYITLGMMFRRFPSLEANHLKPEDMIDDDYFSGHFSPTSTKLHVISPPEVEM